MACRLKSMKELARETMKRKCQEHQEMERMTQMKQQMFSKEAKEANQMLNEDEQEAEKRNQMKPAKKSRQVLEKTFDVNITIGIPGKNIDEKVFDLLVKWLEYRAEMAVLALEREDTFLQLHVQGMVRVKTSSTRILKREIKEVISWETNGPVGASVCLKSLHYTGLHTVIGLIGYFLKDEGAPHFKFYSKNVSEEQKAEGRRMHNIYGASEYKHKLELTLANILGRALQFRKYRVKNPLSITFRRCIAEMIRSGQYIPGFRWLTMAKISRLRAERIWHACTSPESVQFKVPDVEPIFFGVETAARYFKNQEEKTTTGNQDAKIDKDRELAGHSRPADDDRELAANDCESRPAHDEEASTILVVELDKAVNSGADVETLRHALLEAGFAVGMKTTVKAENPMDGMPEYFRLWD
ncbi:hypothetical protein R1flu_001392 [Riccia fluitans]|uniref:Replitron HUH endonuclease domain-containing protein n=1 Tax=Riccia fluitans TaxID=41844 RepID=A0ABD1Y647_9MARC